MRRLSKQAHLTVGVFAAFFASAPVASKADVPNGTAFADNKSMPALPTSAAVNVSSAALEKIKAEAENVGSSPGLLRTAESQVTPFKPRSQVTPFKPRHSHQKKH
jgi:hypothetical protein